MNSAFIIKGRLADLEEVLEKSLAPIAPDPKFVKDLNFRLHTEKPVDIEQKSLASAYLVISLGLFLGVFIFWLIRKIVRNEHRQNSFPA